MVGCIYTIYHSITGYPGLNVCAVGNLVFGIISAGRGRYVANSKIKIWESM